MEKDLGIILKRFYPQKQKFSVLTQNMGKINLVPPFDKKGSKLWPGTLIEFSQSKKFETIIYADNIEIHNIPIDYDYYNMCWQHIILEICYFFMALDDPSPKIFEYVYNALVFFPKTNENMVNNKLIKRFIITYLFFLLGFYHDEKVEEVFSKYNLDVKSGIDFSSLETVKSMESSFDKKLTEDIQIINNWILENLNQHPNNNFFKTKSFIKFL